MRKILFKIWIYILKRIQLKVNESIQVCNEPHVVYFDSFIKDVYICPTGDKALELVENLLEFNKLINRTYVKILYGKANDVFKYKMFKVLDTKFTWECSSEERQRILQYIADTPIRNGRSNI